MCTGIEGLTGDFVERTAGPRPVDQVGTRDTKKTLHLSRPAETPSTGEVMGDLAVRGVVVNGRKEGNGEGVRGPFPSFAGGGMRLTISKTGMKEINNQAVSLTKT